MNGRERFLRCLRFQSVDRAPNIELGAWGQTYERWLREGMPADVDTYFAPQRGNEFFGLDRWEALPVKVGMYPPYEEVTLYEDERVIVYISNEGIKRKAMKEGTARGTRPTMDQFLEFPVKTRDDFLEITKRYNHLSPIRYPQWWEDQVRVWEGRDYPLCLLENATFGLYSMLRRWMGTEDACTVFYDDPALTEEMLDFLTDFFIRTTEKALRDAKPDYFSFFEDFAYKSGPLVSPRLFRQFLLPRYRRITDHLRGHGIDIIIMDSDGNPSVLIPLILEAGINGIWPLEVAAGMDAVALRKEYGKDLILWGGIDKREIAKGGMHIEQELLRQVPYMLEQGGYIPHLDHTFPPDISYQSFLSYMALKRKLLEGQHGRS